MKDYHGIDRKIESQYLEVILESLPHPFYVLDAKTYEIVFANQAALEVGVSSASTCHALTHRRATPCDGKEHPCPLMEVKKTKKPTVVEHIHYDKEGKQIYAEVHGYPIFDDEGNIIQMIEYSINITARKKAELILHKMNKTYENFVPKEFLKHLGEKSIMDIQLGQQVQKEMTILFSDIRSFTSIAESMLPEEAFKFVNSYMNVMGPVIRENNGFIDKFIGDAIMALFGYSPEDAVDAGIAMYHTLKKYNQGRKRAGYLPINIGVGINTGLLMLGVIGESGRMEETVIGDSVNLTSRIEGLTKQYGVSILISHNTLTCLKNPDKYLIRFIDWVKVKGKENALPVYEVFDVDPVSTREKKLETLEIFQEAIAQYQLKRIDKALILFSECVEKNPQDEPAKIYLKRCEDFLGGYFEGSEDLFITRKWTEELAVHNETIDNQHKELFNRINALIEAIKHAKEQEEIQKIIDFLGEYVVVHFTAEEKIMRHHDYPELAYHQGLHNKFIEDFKKIKKEIEVKQDNYSYVVLRTQILITDWLINHIYTQDKQFGKFMKLRN